MWVCLYSPGTNRWQDIRAGARREDELSSDSFHHQVLEGVHQNKFTHESRHMFACVGRVSWAPCTLLAAHCPAQSPSLRPGGGRRAGTQTLTGGGWKRWSVRRGRSRGPVGVGLGGRRNQTLDEGGVIEYVAEIRRTCTIDFQCCRLKYHRSIN